MDKYRSNLELSPAPIAKPSHLLMGKNPLNECDWLVMGKVQVEEGGMTMPCESSGFPTGRGAGGTLSVAGA